MTTLDDPLYCVTVPFNVTIPQGKTSANFSITNTDTAIAHFVGLGITIPSSTEPAAQLGLSWYAVLPSGSCKPATCASLGYNCGIWTDGCCGYIDCGTCASPDTCGGGNTLGVCGCTPTDTCAQQGWVCGTPPTAVAARSTAAPARAASIATSITSALRVPRAARCSASTAARPPTRARAPGSIAGAARAANRASTTSAVFLKRRASTTASIAAPPPTAAAARSIAAPARPDRPAPTTFARAAARPRRARGSA